MTFDPAGLPYRPCVGLMVVNSAGHIWIGQRVEPALQDAPHAWWQMPQGGIDDGEAPAAAALRELFEETGICSGQIIAESRQWFPYDLPAGLIGKIWGGRFRGQTQKWFAIRFRGDDGEINIAPTDHDPEFSRWRWAPIDDVLALVVPFKRDVYTAVLDEFRAYAVPV